MAFYGEKSNFSALTLQSDEATPFTKVYVKEEQSETDCVSSVEEDINCYISEQQLNEAYFNTNEILFNEDKSKFTGFISNEWEKNDPFDKELLAEEKPHVPDVPSFENELQSNEYIFFTKSDDCDMQTRLTTNRKSKETIEKLLHEEIDIKAEKEPGSGRKIRKYATNDMEQAVAAVKRGMSVSAASRQFKVPRITLLYKCNGKYPVIARMGPDTILTSDEEQRLVDWLLKTAEAGFPATKRQLLDSVQMLVKKLNRPNCFKDGRPGRAWFASFLKRHPGISKSLTQRLAHGRSDANESKIRNWFAKVARYLMANRFEDIVKDPRRVYSANEIALFLAPKGNKCLVKRAEKSSYNFIEDDEKECLTCLITANAAGDLLPLMVVYNYGKLPPRVVNSMPDNWVAGKSESGWMTSQTFYEFVTSVFHPWLVSSEIPTPVIFFVNGPALRTTMELNNFCAEHKIILIALFPDPAHILQSMNVATFPPLKSEWKKGVHDLRAKNEGQKLTREGFAPLLNKVITETITKEMIQSGFKSCGIYPFDPNGISYNQYFKIPFDTDNINVQVQQNIKIQDVLRYIELKIGAEKIEQFKQEGNDETSIQPEDRSLFKLWRDIRDDLNSDPPETGDPENKNRVPEKALNSSTRSAEITPQKENQYGLIPPDSQNLTNQHDEVLPSNSTMLDGVPTPTLFWPKTVQTLKRKRVEVSSATSMDSQKEHCREKQEKEQQPGKKGKRKKREESKTQREAKSETNKRKTSFDSPSDSSVNIIGESTEDGCESFKLQYEVGDYVVVKYSNSYFPGKIIDIDSAELLVSTMRQSGLFNWKWSEHEDAMWYPKDAVVNKIQPPQIKSSRGIFIVPEMQTFRDFVALKL